MDSIPTTTTTTTMTTKQSISCFFVLLKSFHSTGRRTTKVPSASLLLLTGGWDDNIILSSSEVFPATGSSPPSLLPGKRSYHTTFLTAGVQPRVATCGGHDGRNSLVSCLILDPNLVTWEGMGNLLQERSQHAAVTLDRQVFIIGGDGSASSSSTTEVLTADSKTWQQGPQLPIEMRYGPCAVAISASSFLVFYEKEIREFDQSIAGLVDARNVGRPLRNQGWREERRWPKLKTSRIWWPGCAKVGGNKVIIGGGFDGKSAHHTTEILDLTTRTIVQGRNMAMSRRSFHIITFNNDAGDLTTLALGGRDNDGKKLETVEEWKAKTETWSTLEDGLKGKRYAFGLVALQRPLKNQGESVLSSTFKRLVCSPQ